MSGVDPFISSRVGIKSLTKTVALQLAENGIRVNAIAPGIIATDIIKKQMHEDKGKRKEREKNIPFHRIGTPEESKNCSIPSIRRCKLYNGKFDLC